MVFISKYQISKFFQSRKRDASIAKALRLIKFANVKKYISVVKNANKNERIILKNVILIVLLLESIRI